MCTNLKTLGFILLLSSLFSQNLFSQSINDSLSTTNSQKEYIIKDNTKIKNEIDSLKLVLKNLDVILNNNLKNLYILKYGKEDGIRVANKQVWNGMTEQMLQDGWGKADTVNANSYKWGIYTQWIYGDITLFFKNGKLFEWEEKKKNKKDN
ncbi:MAG: hypothetical protein CO128_04155 [Ignavibacteriales bacterium CG_4_9_14_3_um_filter_30_11]|nr:MAG: hypothetical protein CO128_04155 [Ignavibacteriales bacterium CG_4_9_14_3_um_filter_30_11]